MSKLTVAIIFGGKSTEHQISILSTKSILKNIDRTKYDLSLIKIDIDGNWFLMPGLDADDQPDQGIALIPGEKGAKLLNTESGAIVAQIDIAFPVLHGVFGEDGTIQGHFKMANVAYVGCGVFASAACMDKDYTKRILRDSDIAIAPYVTVTRNNMMTFEEADHKLGAPLFIKPASLGSSVGVQKVGTKEEFDSALNEALDYDTKVIIEPNIEGREIECAVLGNENPKGSIPGEIVTTTEFYTFDSKYVDKDASSIQIPVQLPDEQITLIRETAVRAYSALGCEGLARVDFFLTKDGTAMINEINTLPGFTDVSMYPKMWEATGIPYSELIDMLIELGLERHERETNLKIVDTKVE